MTERRAKYNAKPVTADGIRFDSKAEFARYRELKLLEQAGEIADLQVHPRFRLLPAQTINGDKFRAVWYEGDFAYTEAGGRVVEDVKGVETAVFKLKWAMVNRTYQDIDWRIIKVAK